MVPGFNFWLLMQMNSTHSGYKIEPTKRASETSWVQIVCVQVSCKQAPENPCRALKKLQAGKPSHREKSQCKAMWEYFSGGLDQKWEADWPCKLKVEKENPTITLLE